MIKQRNTKDSVQVCSILHVAHVDVRRVTLMGIVSEPTLFEGIHQLFLHTVFVRQFVHLATHFLRATGAKHILAEFLVADEPVVDTQEVLLLAFLLERIRDVVLVIPWLLPITVPVGSPFLDVVVRNREEIHGVRYARSACTCSGRCRRPSMISIPCIVLWVPYRVVHTIRCSQLYESFLLILG